MNAWQTFYNLRSQKGDFAQKNFQSLNVVFIQCGAYLRVAFIHTL